MTDDIKAKAKAYILRHYPEDRQEGLLQALEQTEVNTE